MKNPALLYEVSFFSALWMVFLESWKRSCPNFYAHDCKLCVIHLIHWVVALGTMNLIFLKFLFLCTIFFQSPQPSRSDQIIHWTKLVESENMILGK